MPVTQEQLADTLGLSNGHVNRMMQELREQRLVTTAGKQLTINNVERLQNLNLQIGVSALVWCT
jgi:DNA-binding transcriptional regulator LsrR (DeoR family)